MDKMQTVFFDGSVPSELSGDFILPDTYPDVKKILRVRARPVQIGHFMSGGKLEFNGAVDYIVVFSAEGEGTDQLCSVHFAAEYSGSVTPAESFDQPMIVTEPRVTACSARLQNPRKLSLKSTVLTDVRLMTTGTTQPSCDSKLERLDETMPTLIECTFTADHEQISENLEPDAAQPAIDEIITCDAEIYFREAIPRVADDGFTVALKGEAVVDCVYKAQTEPGDYRSFSRKIPLSFVVSADEYAGMFKDSIPGTLQASATGSPTEINAAVGEDSYGERRVLELDLSFDIDVTLYADAETTITLDAYSTSRECECMSKPLDIQSLGKVVASNFSVSESAPRESMELPGDSERNWTVVDCQADVKMNSASVAKGRAQLTGEANVSCLLSERVGNGCELASCEFRLPVKCELSIGEVREPIAFAADCKAFDLRARIDQTRISCDFEVALSTALICRSRREVVDSVKLGDEIELCDDQSTVVLCYPALGETLWQVAKRYRKTVDSLVQNGNVVRVK